MRPQLDNKTDVEEFINFYWLKEELFSFCRTYDLPSNGSKDEMTKRIYEYLKTGKIATPTTKRQFQSGTEFLLKRNKGRK